MNSYSKFKALAGVNSIYLNVTDQNYNLVGSITTGSYTKPDSTISELPSLNISGHIDNVKTTESFTVNNFDYIDLTSNKLIELTCAEVEINTPTSFKVFRNASDEPSILVKRSDNSSGSLATTYIELNSGKSKATGELNGDIEIKSKTLTYNGNQLVSKIETSKQVQFDNAFIKGNTTGIVELKFSVISSDKISEDDTHGEIYNAILGEFQSIKKYNEYCKNTYGSAPLRFKMTPLMQATKIDGTTFDLKLAEMKFDTNSQILTVKLDKVVSDISAGTYRFTLLGH